MSYGHATQVLHMAAGREFHGFSEVWHYFQIVGAFLVGFYGPRFGLEERGRKLPNENIANKN